MEDQEWISREERSLVSPFGSAQPFVVKRKQRRRRSEYRAMRENHLLEQEQQ